MSSTRVLSAPCKAPPVPPAPPRLQLALSYQGLAPMPPPSGSRSEASWHFSLLGRLLGRLGFCGPSAPHSGSRTAGDSCNGCRFAAGGFSCRKAVQDFVPLFDHSWVGANSAQSSISFPVHHFFVRILELVGVFWSSWVPRPCFQRTRVVGRSSRRRERAARRGIV